MTRHYLSSFKEFRCSHCHVIVPCANLISAVNNRNHCPYCLWSRHLDLFSAGDRLSACKAPMKPVGLAIKRSRDRYRSGPRGELMLIHVCVECNSPSINRIAADDHPEAILSIYKASFTVDRYFGVLNERHGIVALTVDDIEVVYTQLYGRNAEVPASFLVE